MKIIFAMIKNKKFSESMIYDIIADPRLQSLIRENLSAPESFYQSVGVLSDKNQSATKDFS